MIYDFDNIMLHSSSNEEYFRENIVEKVKIPHFMLNIFFLQNFAPYEMKLKNLVEPDRPHITI